MNDRPEPAPAYGPPPAYSDVPAPSSAEPPRAWLARTVVAVVVVGVAVAAWWLWHR
jgi:hypothetical protein